MKFHQTGIPLEKIPKICEISGEIEKSCRTTVMEIGKSNISGISDNEDYLGASREEPFNLLWYEYDWIKNWSTFAPFSETLGGMSEGNKWVFITFGFVLFSKCTAVHCIRDKYWAFAIPVGACGINGNISSSTRTLLIIIIHNHFVCWSDFIFDKTFYLLKIWCTQQQLLFQSALEIHIVGDQPCHFLYKCGARAWMCNYPNIVFMCPEVPKIIGCLEYGRWEYRAIGADMIERILGPSYWTRRLISSLNCTNIQIFENWFIKPLNFSNIFFSSTGSTRTISYGNFREIPELVLSMVHLNWFDQPRPERRFA